MKKEIAELFNRLEHNPKQGTPIGNHCYKIRLAIASKGTGKSGGARVITYLRVQQTAVYLLSIYDKSEKKDIPDNELYALLRLIP